MANRASADRRAAVQVLSDLGENELLVARTFLEFLRARAADPATMEILQSPALMRDVRAARADRAKGHTARFVPWEKVKRRV